MAIIFIAVICFMIWFTWLHDHDLFSPGMIYCLVWAFVILLGQLHLSGLQEPLTNYTWLMIIVSIIAFVFGTFIPGLFHRIKIRDRLDSLITPPRLPQKWNYRFRIILAIYCGVAMLAYLITVAFLGLPPIFNSDPDHARLSYALPGVWILTSSFVIVAIIGGIYLLSTRSALRLYISRNTNLLAIAAVLISVLCLSTLLVRGSLIQIFVTFFIASKYLVRSKKWLKFITIFSIVGVFALFLLGMWRARNNGFYIWDIGQYKLTGILRYTAEPYTYIALNIENFQRITNILAYHTNGLVIFGPFLKLLAQVGIGSYVDPLPFNGSYTVSLFNARPYLSSLYMDFGFWGILFGPLFIGMIGGWIYSRMLKRRTMGSLLLHSLFSMLSALSFFSDYYFHSYIWWFLICVYLFDLFLDYRRKRLPHALTGVHTDVRT